MTSKYRFVLSFCKLPYTFRNFVRCVSGRVMKFLKTVFVCARIVRVLFTDCCQSTKVFLLGLTSKIQLLCCLFVSGRKVEKFR